MNKKINQIIKNYILLTLGSLIVAISISLFFAKHNLVFGGVTGLAIVIAYPTNLSISQINILINIPLFILGIKIKGTTFFIRSVYTTSMVSVFLELTDFLKTIQTDLSVSSVFGGILLGTGVCIVALAGGSTGGTDMVAMILNKYIHVSLSRLMFFIDSIIILLGIILFGLNNALYALIVIFFISQTVQRGTPNNSDEPAPILNYI